MTIASDRTQLGGNSANQLRALVTRIQQVEDVIADCNNDKKEIYGEAKASGFDKRAIRRVVQRLKSDRTQLDEFEAMVDLYEQIVQNVDAEIAAKGKDFDPLE
jgi:uncharacterized protein (UPF0335 family)